MVKMLISKSDYIVVEVFDACGELLLSISDIGYSGLSSIIDVVIKQIGYRYGRASRIVIENADKCISREYRFTPTLRPISDTHEL